MAGGHGVYRIAGRNIGSQYVSYPNLISVDGQLTQLARPRNLGSDVRWSIPCIPKDGREKVDGRTKS